MMIYPRVDQTWWYKEAMERERKRERENIREYKEIMGTYWNKYE
jgi:hypothetical protein